MYLDQKVTIWQRVHFNNEQDMQRAIEMLKRRGETINDVCEHLKFHQRIYLKQKQYLHQLIMKIILL